MRLIKVFLFQFLAIAHFLTPATTVAADSSFLLETTVTTPYTSTFLGNGNFSYVSTPLGMDSARSFHASVYDHGPADVPRIAVLPAWNEIGLSNGEEWLSSNSSLSDYLQTLDMHGARLKTQFTWNQDSKRIKIEYEVFVSRSNPNLAAIKLSVTPTYSGSMRLSFPIRAWPAPKRLSLEKLDKIDPMPPGKWPSVWYPGHMIVQDRGGTPDGVWMVSESEGRHTIVAEAIAIEWPEELKVNPTMESSKDQASLNLVFDVSKGISSTFYKYVGIVSSHQSAKPLTTAFGIVNGAKSQGYASILKEHLQAWEKLWETDIVVENNPDLQRVIHSMIFYLLCSIQENSDFSIPPMGLSSDGYYGHLFWDGDTYIFPALVVMHPEIARSMVMFRSKTLEAARKNAQGNKYRGAKYPWEADELGNETTPKFAWQNALYEIHVTGDVSLAQWQYYLATGDREWLEQFGYPVLKETADFWVSRVTHNKEKQRYEIHNVVSVDEGLVGINNDTYTNTIAKRNLEIAIEASKILQKQPDPEWEKVAQNIYIPYDEVEKHHPTYENAPQEKRGGIVPLMSYPLGFSMSDEIKKNDLSLAIDRMTSEGPGAMMTVTLFPIIAAELQNKQWIDDLFPKSYLSFLRPPYNAMAETPNNESINFLTGAGGFLQQFIFGYSGLRLTQNGLEQKFKPILPSRVQSIHLKNFTVRNKPFDLLIQTEQK